MTSIGNKEIFAKNLVYYIERSGKTQKELSEMVGVAASTFNDWCKAKKYPRIDKIEILANFFGIQKSDLIEAKMTDEGKKNSDAIADITKSLFLNDKLCAVVSLLCSAGFDESKLDNIKEYIEFQSKR
jgi:transcriptional regulator with XRE-family HTH domain